MLMDFITAGKLQLQTFIVEKLAADENDEERFPSISIECFILIVKFDQIEPIRLLRLYD